MIRGRVGYTVWVVIAGLALMAVGGCVSASSLAPLAKQNDQNLRDLTVNVRASSALSGIFIDAVTQRLINDRISLIEVEMIRVLGRVGEPLTGDPTWEVLFGKNSKLKRQRELVKLADATQRKNLAGRYGWVVTTVVDKDFTPKIAKKLQGSLQVLKETYPKPSRKAAYIQHASELLRPHDPVLNHQMTLAEGLKNLQKNLSKNLDSGLLVSHRLSRSLIEATDATVEVEQAVVSILGSEEAGELVGTVAKRNIEDPDKRRAVVDLFKDTTAILKGR
jgi:hypothetical protein